MPLLVEHATSRFNKLFYVFTADDQSPGLSAARDPRTRRLLQAEEAAGNDTSEEHITPAAFVAHREVLVTSGNTSENGNATEETHICTPPGMLITITGFTQKIGTLAQCWFTVGPPSTTLAQQ